MADWFVSVWQTRGEELVRSPRIGGEVEVRRLKIERFRGVADGSVTFPRRALLVGENNSGKSTVCEALELVLGPERLFRRPVVDEHDFFGGDYLDGEKNPIEITEAVFGSSLRSFSHIA